MNIASLIEIIREDYLYDVNEPYRWSDAFLLRSFLEAERQACNRWNLLYDDTLSITLQHNVAAYLLNSKITALDSAWLNGLQVTQYSKEEMDANFTNWRTDTGVVGVPVGFVVNGRTLRITPSPDGSKDATFIQDTQPTGTASGQTWLDTANSLLYVFNGSTWTQDSTASLGSLNLEVYRLPTAETITASYTPEIPEEHHRKLIHWVLFEAYSKKDADNVDGESYDIQRAAVEFEVFNAWFGKPVSAAIRQNQLEGPKVLRLRQTPYINDSTRSDSFEDWN